jgi:hypothetical protein
MGMGKRLLFAWCGLDVLYLACGIGSIVFAVVWRGMESPSAMGTIRRLVVSNGELIGRSRDVFFVYLQVLQWGLQLLWSWGPSLLLHGSYRFPVSSLA